MGPDDRDSMRRPGGPSPSPAGGSGGRSSWSLLGVDGGLLLGFVLIGIGLGALAIKGFDRPDHSSLQEEFNEPAYYDPFYNGGFEPLHVNTATREDLLLLPMVSARIADGIIARRPFKFTEELLEVRGIGEANIGIISMYLYGFEDQPEPRQLKPPGIPDA